MEEKEKNSTSEELNTNNLFALASQEIEEEKRKENLENNKIEEDSDKTSLEDLFKIEKLNNDNKNIDSDFGSILNDNQDIELEENNESVDNTEINPFLNVTSDNKDTESKEESIESVDNTEINPFLSITPDKKDTESKEESTESVDNTEINPFLSITPDNKDTESKEESTESVDNTEENPFFAGQDTSINDNNIENPFFRKNNIQLNEKNIHTNNQKIDLSNIPHYDVKIQKKKPKKMKMILGVLSYAIFIWLLLIGIALLIYVGNVKIKEMKGDYTPPKYNAYVVLTGSMLPKIKVEDVVVTKKIEAKDLKEGDIITFASSDERYAGTIITHRIKKKYYDSTTGKYTFQSQGDNNNVADNALVEEQNIYGKVILKIPKLGYLQLFLASKGGWILVILIPCAVVVSFDIVKLFKMMAQKRKFKIVK